MSRVRRQFGHIRVLPDLLNEKFKILALVVPVSRFPAVRLLLPQTGKHMGLAGL